MIVPMAVTVLVGMTAIVRVLVIMCPMLTVGMIVLAGVFIVPKLMNVIVFALFRHFPHPCFFLCIPLRPSRLCVEIRS
ncbi:MAG TPA: hypothetical protein VFX54_03450, partial [Candidatus Binatia bacterium]|nr:hypothetical protein [Candidatus Binatia bacterium]